MTLDTIFKILALAVGGGVLVQLIRLSVWMGEIKTKVEIMWAFLSNDLHADIQKRLEEKRGQ